MAITYAFNAFQYNQQNRVGQRNVLPTQIKDRLLDSISVNRLLAGDITVSVNVGETTDGSVKIDGSSTNIVVNDGTNDRVLIGKQEGGF